jgi:hypothetical protein
MGAVEILFEMNGQLVPAGPAYYDQIDQPVVHGGIGREIHALPGKPRVASDAEREFILHHATDHRDLGPTMPRPRDMPYYPDSGIDDKNRRKILALGKA